MVEAGDVESVSMRAIAKTVGVTPPAIYMHFEDKDELFQAICDRRFAQLNEAFDAAIAEGDQSPLDRLLRCGRAYIRFGLDNPEAYRFLMGTRTDEDISQLMASSEPTQGDMAFMKLVGLVSDCIEAGDIKPMDTLEASLILWSAVHGLTTLMIAKPSFAWPDGIVEKLLDTALLGLAPRTP